MSKPTYVRVAANGVAYTTTKKLAEADKVTILAKEPAVDRFGKPLPPTPHLPEATVKTEPAASDKPPVGDKK